jgi:hypothetical protein
MEKTSESILGTEFHSCIFTRNGQLQMPFFMFSENTVIKGNEWNLK